MSRRRGDRWWRTSQRHTPWTDDCLAAFAQAADLTPVTLDRAFIKRYPSMRVEVIQRIQSP